jgi:hypothetical protein
LIVINCLILVILLCVTSLAGCIGWFFSGESTSLYVGLYREHSTRVERIGMFSCGAKNNTNIFDESNVSFDFYFGHRKIPEPFTDMMTILVVLLENRSAIYTEEHDDYRNIPNFFIAREFTIVEFFSENYVVKADDYGASAYTHHEKFTVPQELYMSSTQNEGIFHFAVLGLKYNLITHKYNFLNADYSIYHLISISYQKLGEGKIKLSESIRLRTYES